MKSFLLILVLPFLMSAQVLAFVCPTECRIEKISVKEVFNKVVTPKACHEQSSRRGTESNQSEDCGSKLCQFDKINTVDLFEFGADIISANNLYVSKSYQKALLKQPKKYAFQVKSPPGSGPYLRVALFIQKSSYLI